MQIMMVTAKQKATKAMEMTSPQVQKNIMKKKHHDPNNTKHVAYKFGIPGGAIFKRKGNVTKLIEINHKRIKPIEVTMRKDGKYNNMKHKF